MCCLHITKKVLSDWHAWIIPMEFCNIIEPELDYLGPVDNLIRDLSQTRSQLLVRCAFNNRIDKTIVYEYIFLFLKRISNIVYYATRLVIYVIERFSFSTTQQPPSVYYLSYHQIYVQKRKKCLISRPGTKYDVHWINC